VFASEHQDKAKGAKAKLAIEVCLSVENPDSALFGVKAQTKLTLPARPASVTFATGGESSDGTPALFVRQSGSTGDSPKQQVICTQDGRPVDPETGKPKEESEQ